MVLVVNVMRICFLRKGLNYEKTDGNFLQIMRKNVELHSLLGMFLIYIQCLVTTCTMTVSAKSLK